jgi:hypothetical protein
MESLAEQTGRITRRARLVRSTLLNLMGAIAAMIMSSLLNGVAILWPQAAIAAAILFVCGMTLVMTGVVCAAIELMLALNPVELETGVVSELIGFPTSERAKRGVVTGLPPAQAPVGTPVSVTVLA